MCILKRIVGLYSYNFIRATNYKTRGYSQTLKLSSLVEKNCTNFQKPFDEEIIKLLKEYEVAKKVIPQIVNCASEIKSIQEIDNYLQFLNCSLVFLGKSRYSDLLLKFISSLIPKHISKVSDKNFWSVIKTLGNLGFEDKNIRIAISKYPELVLMSQNQIDEIFSNLMTLFRKKDVLKLLTSNSFLFSENFENIKDKVEYISREMGIDQNEAVIGNILSFSLLHLRTRHECLLRCGFYKIPRKIGNINNNASLKEIVVSNDHYFSKNLSNIPLHEYKVFCKLFEEEMLAEKELLNEIDEED